MFLWNTIYHFWISSFPFVVFNSPKFPVYLINNEGELNKALAFGYIYSRSGPQLCFQLLLFDKALHAFLKFYYNLFVFIERGGEREREERNINVWLLLVSPLLGTWPTTQAYALMPWLGIEPATLWFAGRHSIHWATPARASFNTFKAYSSVAFSTVPIVM